MEMIKGEPTDLVTFGDKGKYSEPKFVWDKPVAPTALVFMNSDKLGKQYLNDMLVGSVKDGRIFHFKLDNTTNNNRTGLSLPGSVHNKIMTKENLGDMQSGINFASGFGIITDLAVGPHDGYLYIISGDKNPEVGSNLQNNTCKVNAFTISCLLKLSLYYANHNPTHLRNDALHISEVTSDVGFSWDLSSSLCYLLFP